MGRERRQGGSQLATTSRGGLYFSFFAGAMAWTIHLIGSYLIAEFGCLAQVDDARWLGITLIAWSLLGLSLLMLSISAVAALVGWRAKRRFAAREREVGASDELDTETYFARSGAIMSAIFALVIVAQTVPIFYFLGSC